MQIMLLLLRHIWGGFIRLGLWVVFKKPPQTRCDYSLNEAIRNFSEDELKVLLCFGRCYDRILALIIKGWGTQKKPDAVFKNSTGKKNTSLKQSQEFVPIKQTFIIPLLLSVSTSTC